MIELSNSDRLKIIDTVEEKIAQSGRCVVSVPGPFGPYAYTVGHAERQLPDLIITGLMNDTAQYVLNEVGSRLFETKNTGAKIPEVIALENIVVRLEPAPWALLTHATLVRHRKDPANAQDLPEMLQVVWPDASGYYPDDENYQHIHQPLFSKEGEVWYKIYRQAISGPATTNQ